jgi:formylmethanofuran dehydrogenase subunit B
MGDAWIDGRPVELQAACAEAARLLDASRAPVIAGLGTDIAGARATIALAQRLGAVIDHMSSDTLLRDLEVLRDAGMMVTTPAEARSRADLVLVVGPTACAAQAAMLPAAKDKLDRQIVWLCPGRVRRQDEAGAQTRTLGRDPRDLPVLIAALRAAVNHRPFDPLRISAKSLGAVAGQLERARFGVALWSAVDIDTLVIEMLCGLVKDLNAKTRFSGLPLPPDDNAVGVLQACGWMTGVPPRTGFARGVPEHDPWRFDARRLIDSGEADCALWISAYRPSLPPWQRDLPTIALTSANASFRRSPRVHVAVGRPGVEHGAVEHVAAAGTLAWTAASAPRDTVRVADAIAAIAAALPNGGAAPC